MIPSITPAQRAEHHAKTIAWLKEQAQAAEPVQAEACRRAARSVQKRAEAAFRMEAHNDCG